MDSPEGPVEANRYKTPDLYFAACLAALDFDLLGLEFIGDRAFFCFAMTEAEVTEMQRGWALDTVTVLASLYADKIRRLKSAAMRHR